MDINLHTVGDTDVDSSPSARRFWRGRRVGVKAVAEPAALQ
jgi:hypothetical protein